MTDIDWLHSEDIRPYVFVRQESRLSNAGQLHKIDWFSAHPIYKNPLAMDQLGFADRILHLEGQAFGPKALQMPRWVFYDCAVVPGFIAGFAHRTATLPAHLKPLFEGVAHDEWTPLSLFIIIPTMVPGEWAAHNLCSINSALPKAQQFYGMGFLTKAFGLWYANVKICVGFTQWQSPAIRLHTHYGDFEVLTAYTPVHSYARTMTYRCKVNVDEWHRFFTRMSNPTFQNTYSSAGFQVDPKDDQSLIAFQRRLEKGEGPFYLDALEVKDKGLDESLTVYRRKDGAVTASR
jgi:hypothetical protein